MCIHVCSVSTSFRTPFCLLLFHHLSCSYSTLFCACLQSVPPGGGNSAYELGHAACSGIDLNCHGFTEFMCQERVEYAWLMQLLVGRITGAISSEQVRRTNN